MDDGAQDDDDAGDVQDFGDREREICAGGRSSRADGRSAIGDAEDIDRS